MLTKILDRTSEGGIDEEEIDVKRRKEDALLLLRGFDSISQTLSSGARYLAEPPSLTELLHGKINSSSMVWASISLFQIAQMMVM
ncbi:hypothetical protein LINPERPRIM_LOCUS11126 [Linum perenne]